MSLVRGVIEDAVQRDREIGKQEQTLIRRLVDAGDVLNATRGGEFEGRDVVLDRSGGTAAVVDRAGRPPEAAFLRDCKSPSLQ
jgi:hypothetical protein